MTLTLPLSRPERRAVFKYSADRKKTSENKLTIQLNACLRIPGEDLDSLLLRSLSQLSISDGQTWPVIRELINMQMKNK